MDTLDMSPFTADAERRLLIHAPNIHQGGGRTLLVALLDALVASNKWKDVVVTLDERLKVDEYLISKLTISRVAPTFLARLGAEWTLSRRARKEDLLLCFGNLPPLLPVQGRVVLFLQNYYLIGGRSALKLPIRLRARLWLERLWLRGSVHHCHVVVVQSLTMQRLVKDVLGVEAIVAPFVGATLPHGVPFLKQTLDFLYVASGEPHKNHRRLIEAWVHLANQGVFPSLGLTLDPLLHGDLYRWIQEETSSHSLQIKMLGSLSTAQLEKTYLGSRALIFPSLFESFGLPLIEAKSLGLSIVASERDYVRDVITPEESFDPESAVSIARAVIRFLHLPQETTSLLTAQEFLIKILSASRIRSTSSSINID